MAGTTLVVIGDQVPIVLQLADGDTGKYPQAEIRDNAGNLLTILDLAHVASGIYAPASAYTMPNEIFIAATFIVYDDAGHTTESTRYLRDVDTFLKATAALSSDVLAIKAKTDQLDFTNSAVNAYIKGGVNAWRPSRGGMIMPWSKEKGDEIWTVKQRDYVMNTLAGITKGLEIFDEIPTTEKADQRLQVLLGEVKSQLGNQIGEVLNRIDAMSVMAALQKHSDQSNDSTPITFQGSDDIQATLNEIALMFNQVIHIYQTILAVVLPDKALEGVLNAGIPERIQPAP